MSIWGGGYAGATASLIGDWMSQSGAHAANQQNQADYQESMNWQESSFIQAQNYNAKQAQLARNWAENMQLQAEQYNTNMSDTAMQRRVADLKEAGINPLLAISQGGASTPMMSGMNSATAMSPSGGGAPLPNISNASAAFGNLGGQVSSALSASQTQAQIDLLKAQTDNTTAKTGAEVPAQVAYLKSLTNASDNNAKQILANIKLIDTQNWETAEKGSMEKSQGDLNAVMRMIQDQNVEVIKGTRDALIAAQQSDTVAKQLGVTIMRNKAQVEGGKFGLAIDYLDKALQPVGTAMGAMKGILNTGGAQ